MMKSGIILEGGAVRGVFSSGALDYLMEKEYYIPYVIGVSAGACNAIDYVSKQIGRTRDCMILNDKEYAYFNLKKSVKQKSLFDMNMLFEEFPNKIFPFDYDTYFDSHMECEITVTNCETGRAEYLTENGDKKKLMDVCRASSSMPIVSPMVEIDGVPYLDGGIADSIPILHSLATGHKRNVIILTRNKGYRKKISRRSGPIYAAIYRDYPNLARAIWTRPYIYNKTLEYIERWEQEGKIFVLRPRIKTVSRTETNNDILMDFYYHGYKQMKEQFDAMQAFLER